jgi:large repetitive protein
MIHASRPFAICLALLPVSLAAQPVQTADAKKRTVFSATGLPPGVSIDPYSGVISGTFDRTAIVDGNMTYDVTINVADVNGGNGRTNVRIVVPNAPPTAANDSVIVDPDTTSTIPVLANDCDADGDALVIISVHSEIAQIQGFGPSQCDGQ